MDFGFKIWAEGGHAILTNLSRIMFTFLLFTCQLTFAASDLDIVMKGSQKQSFGFTFDSPPKKIKHELRQIVFPSGWSPPQIKDSKAKGFVEFEIIEGKKARVTTSGQTINLEVIWGKKRPGKVIVSYSNVTVEGKSGTAAFMTSSTPQGKDLPPLRFHTGIRVVDRYNPVLLHVDKGGYKDYVVKKGDTLWGIAKKHGADHDPHFWPVIARANLRGVAKSGGLIDPHFIKPGLKLRIPQVLTEENKKRAAYLSGITPAHESRLKYRKKWEFDYLLKPIKDLSDWGNPKPEPKN